MLKVFDNVGVREPDQTVNLIRPPSDLTIVKRERTKTGFLVKALCKSYLSLRTKV